MFRLPLTLFLFPHLGTLCLARRINARTPYISPTLLSSAGMASDVDIDLYSPAQLNILEGIFKHDTKPNGVLRNKSAEQRTVGGVLVRPFSRHRCLPYLDHGHHISRIRTGRNKSVS
jgi:hypothetical protein